MHEILNGKNGKNTFVILNSSDQEHFSIAVIDIWQAWKYEYVFRFPFYLVFFSFVFSKSSMQGLLLLLQIFVGIFLINIYITGSAVLKHYLFLIFNGQNRTSVNSLHKTGDKTLENEPLKIPTIMKWASWYFTLHDTLLRARLDQPYLHFRWV